MRILIIIIIFCNLSCKNKPTYEKVNNPLNDEYKNLPLEEKKDTSKLEDDIVLDSIYIGASFYKINSFKNFKFIDIDKNEDFLIDNDIMYNIIVYQKNNLEYAVLSVLEENIGMGELSSEWKETKKTIVDYIKYPIDYNKICWHHSFINENDIECCLYVVYNSIDKKFKAWRIDYKNQKIKYLDKFIDFECY